MCPSLSALKSKPLRLSSLLPGSHTASNCWRLVRQGLPLAEYSAAMDPALARAHATLSRTWRLSWSVSSTQSGCRLSRSSLRFFAACQTPPLLPGRSWCSFSESLMLLPTCPLTRTPLQVGSSGLHGEEHARPMPRSCGCAPCICTCRNQWLPAFAPPRCLQSCQRCSAGGRGFCHLPLGTLEM